MIAAMHRAAKLTAVAYKTVQVMELDSSLDSQYRLGQTSI